MTEGWAAHLNGEDPFDNQRSIPVVAKMLEIFPRSEGPGVGLFQPLHSQKDCLLGLLVPFGVQLVMFLWIIWELGNIQNGLHAELCCEYWVR